MSSPPIIHISSLTKKFKQLTAVDELNLEINSNVIFGFLGPNGAGKSTCLRMMLSLMRPDSGSIHIFGKDLNKDRASIMKRIGCIVEKPDFYLFLTAKENLRMLSGLSGVIASNRQLEEVIELVGLNGRENDKVKTYSHGMKQRLGLAQAILHDPELIILDEPTTGLDPQGIIDLRNLILKLKQERGKTIILSSHILSEVELIADEMLIMHKGKSVVQGKVIDLLSDQDLIVYVETSDNLRCSQLIHDKFPQTNIKNVNANTISCSVSRIDLPILNKILSESELKVYSTFYKRKLEDYFLKLTSN
jgi:ABC-type multidrug transport system ATPase subunit